MTCSRNAAYINCPFDLQGAPSVPASLAGGNASGSLRGPDDVVTHEHTPAESHGPQAAMDGQQYEHESCRADADSAHDDRKQASEATPASSTSATLQQQTSAEPGEEVGSWRKPHGDLSKTANAHVQRQVAGGDSPLKAALQAYVGGRDGMSKEINAEGDQAPVGIKTSMMQGPAASDDSATTAELSFANHGPLDEIVSSVGV